MFCHVAYVLKRCKLNIFINHVIFINKAINVLDAKMVLKTHFFIKNFALLYYWIIVHIIYIFSQRNSVEPFLSDGLCSNFKRCEVLNKNMVCTHVIETFCKGRSIVIALEVTNTA